MGIQGLYDEEKRSWVWDFKGEAATLQIDEQEQTCSKQILTGPPRNSGTQRKVQQTGLSGFLLFATFSLHYDAKVMLSSFKQVFLLEFL